MSVINQMLQDLDQRSGTVANGSLDREVRPLPPESGGGVGRWLAAVAVLLLAGAAGTWFWMEETQPHAVLPVLPPVPAPAVPPPLPAAAPVLPADYQLKLATDLNFVPVPPAEPPQPTGPHTDIQPVAAAKSTASALAPSVPTPVSQAVVPPKLPAEADTARTKAITAPMGSGPASIDKQIRLNTPRERAEYEYRRAVNAYNLGRSTEAQGSLAQALREDATLVPARQLLLKLLVDQRAYDEARQLLMDGLALQPSQAGWAMALARLQMEAGNPKGAWLTLETSMAYGKGNADYQGLAGAVLHRSQRYGEAAEHYRSATRLLPSDGRLWLGLGLALEADGVAEEARQAFQNAKAAANLPGDLQNFVEQKLK